MHARTHLRLALPFLKALAVRRSLEAGHGLLQQPLLRQQSLELWSEEDGKENSRGGVAYCTS